MELQSTGKAIVGYFQDGQVNTGIKHHAFTFSTWDTYEAGAGNGGNPSSSRHSVGTGAGGGGGDNLVRES